MDIKDQCSQIVTMIFAKNLLEDLANENPKFFDQLFSEISSRYGVKRKADLETQIVNAQAEIIAITNPITVIADPK